jgi:hypothetical protein
VRRTLFILSLLASTLGSAPAPADLGPLEPLADLHRAVRESLGLPEPLIVQLLERGLPAPELPVVGLIAAQVSVAPERLVDLRLAGRSWIDITIEVGASPEVFYVPFDRDPGPPYGKAWGYYQKTPRAQWRTIRLTDIEVVDLANVKLCADHYRMKPTRVVQLRGSKSYAQLHGELHAKRSGGNSKAAASKSDKTKSDKAKSAKVKKDKAKKDKPKGKPPG